MFRVKTSELAICQSVGVIWIDAAGSKCHKLMNELCRDETNGFDLLNIFFFKDFAIFVILKMKIFLTLHLTIFEWSASNFEPFGLGLSREKLCNATIVYYPIKRFRCVSAIGFVPRMFFKKPYNNYLNNLVWSIRTISYRDPSFFLMACMTHAWDIRIEKTHFNTDLARG